ncbi:hypothetical protein [Escherichia phage EC.W2-6]|uniref:Uncharacterized protein n=1 Tax=Escherichia phage EC.W8-1 TaxID=3236638 RepID=A0AB39CBV1_9CAUD
MRSMVKDWVTKSGLRAVIMHMNDSHFCGYVELPDSLKHKNFTGYNGNEEVCYVSVHGGVTWQDTLEEMDGLDTIGFDCAHAGDKTRFNPNGVPRTETFCINECEQMAEQLRDLESNV